MEDSIIDLAELLITRRNQHGNNPPATQWVNPGHELSKEEKDFIESYGFELRRIDGELPIYNVYNI